MVRTMVEKGVGPGPDIAEAFVKHEGKRIGRTRLGSSTKSMSKRIVSGVANVSSPRGKAMTPTTEVMSPGRKAQHTAKWARTMTKVAGHLQPTQGRQVESGRLWWEYEIGVSRHCRFDGDPEGSSTRRPGVEAWRPVRDRPHSDQGRICASADSRGHRSIEASRSISPCPGHHSRGVEARRDPGAVSANSISVAASDSR
jgi:hypothetical protein